MLNDKVFQHMLKEESIYWLDDLPFVSILLVSQIKNFSQKQKIDYLENNFKNLGARMGLTHKKLPHIRKLRNPSMTAIFTFFYCFRYKIYKSFGALCHFSIFQLISTYIHVCKHSRTFSPFSLKEN